MSRGFFRSLEELCLINLPKFRGWERRQIQGGGTVDLKDDEVKMLPTFCSKVLVEIYSCLRLSHIKIKAQQLSLVGLTANVFKQLVRMGMASKSASMVSAYSVTLAELKSVMIDNMVDVEHMHLPKKLLQSLSSLQSLVITHCRTLKTVCGRVILRYLTNLEPLRISHCLELDLSVEDEGDQEDYDTRMCGDDLEHLLISDCNGLKAPHGMCNLTSLTFLNIWGCEGLRSLPRRLILPFLTTLWSLSIEWCRELDLSGELDDQEEKDSNASNCQFSGPSKLRELAIFGNANMVSLPEWFEHLTDLEYLDISFCENLKALPEWFPQLKSLKHLNVSECGQLSQRCKKDTGEDWPKIYHIRRVYT